MPFTSTLYPGEPLIDDSNASKLAPAVNILGPDGQPRLRGRIPRDYTKEPFGSLPL